MPWGDVFVFNSLVSQAEQIAELVQFMVGFVPVQIAFTHCPYLVLYLMFVEASKAKKKIDAVSLLMLLLTPGTNILAIPK